MFITYMKNKRLKVVIISVRILAVICIGYALMLKELPHPLRITYIGKVAGWTDYRIWTVNTKELALQNECIKADHEMYNKILNIDGSKYDIILSNGSPIKKLIYAPETNDGTAIYKGSETDKIIYIYFIKKSICIIPNEV